MLEVRRPRCLCIPRELPCVVPLRHGALNVLAARVAMRNLPPAPPAIPNALLYLQMRVLATRVRQVESGEVLEEDEDEVCLF